MFMSSGFQDGQLAGKLHIRICTRGRRGIGVPTVAGVPFLLAHLLQTIKIHVMISLGI